MNGLIAALLSFGLAFSVPVHAQSNDNDYTPLNSRIKRSRQFSTELPPRFVPEDKLTNVQRDSSRSVFAQLGKCLYKRSTSVAQGLLDKTDIGFVNFDQIQLPLDRALKIYGFQDCLERVAQAKSASVSIRFTPGNLRQWLIQAAYFERYPSGPTWLKPGYVLDDRKYPLSAGDSGAHVALDFADCVVVADPNNADYFYRTVAGSADEREAVKVLTPALGPCLPQGQQVQLSPGLLRMWVGEALWQAANHGGPAPAAIPQDSQ